MGNDGNLQEEHTIFIEIDTWYMTDISMAGGRATLDIVNGDIECYYFVLYEEVGEMEWKRYVKIRPICVAGDLGGAKRDLASRGANANTANTPP